MLDNNSKSYGWSLYLGHISTEKLLKALFLILGIVLLLFLPVRLSCQENVHSAKQCKIVY